MTPLLRSLIILLFFHPSKYRDQLKAPTPSPEQNVGVVSAALNYPKKEGSILTLCTLTPGAVAVGDSFRLDVKLAFIEQPAARNRPVPDTARGTGPQLVLACQPTTRLGKLGTDWDLKLNLATRNPVYGVQVQGQVITFRLPPPYAYRPFALRLRVRDQRGKWREHRLAVYPAATAF